MDNNKILLQKRKGSKLWPGYYALPAGHIDKGENQYEALIREAKEELGLDITDDEIKYLVGSASIDTAKGINKHYNECYLILKDVDISEIKLQKEEVSEVRYFLKKKYWKE